MEEKYSKFCERLFVFYSVPKPEAEAMISAASPQICRFERGDVIYSPQKFTRHIGFIAEGECEVLRHRENATDIPLNTLYPYDSFGILSLFSDRQDFPTEIRAAKPTVVLFFPLQDVLSWIRQSEKVSVNLLTFLCNRVEFLNRKIGTLSGKDAESKVAAELTDMYRRFGETFTLNAKKTADAVGCGRASLYRALDAFTAAGYIEYSNRKILIKNPDGLERISK